HIDVVQTHTTAPDQLQGGAGIDQFSPHLGGTANEQHFDPFLVDVFDQLVLRNVVSGHLEAFLEQAVLGLGGDPVVGVYPHVQPFFLANSSITSTSTCTLSIGRALY